MLPTFNARARVMVTLEIPITDTWGGTVDINQVVEQARESALGKLRELVRGGARVIGDPMVTVIMMDAKL